MKSDIEIADSVKLENITMIAERAGIGEEYLETYGRNKAKVDISFLKDNCDRADGKLVLVTAITPTPAGEGKTTTTIALGDALRKIGKKSTLALREPSMGPVFGVKGGATGGGWAQVAPMAEINLHFTGDFHAIEAANNLVAAMVDNHIYQGNALGIDPSKVVIRRAMDCNDRELRHIVAGLGGKNGVVREDGFDITVASEVMAIFCLSSSLSDLKARIGRMIVAYTYDGRAVTAGDLKAAGAVAAILKDAIKPNLVQTLEGTPAFIHGGPFANIAHGCNSVLATRMALKCGEYTVTEAGFGADLGAEKFFDIKCRTASLIPSAVVIVATTRALKMHGGMKKDELKQRNDEALLKGCSNLRRHIRNMSDVYSMPVVVALNRFTGDTEEEIGIVRSVCAEEGVPMALSEGWEKGGSGAVELAEKVVELCERNTVPTYAYELDASLEDKITAVVKRVYRGAKVSWAPGTRTKLKKAAELGCASFPVCMAKTQYSFSDDPKKLAAPEGFTLTVKDIRISMGAGFIVVLTGEIMTMPGLPPIPQAERIDVTDDGVITGLM